MQALLTITLLLTAGAIRLPAFFPITVALMFLMATFSATHDIACDGLYLMSLDKVRQASFSGVMAAFSRHGIPFDGSEADDQLGGNWYHGVYETVHIISSRKTTQYTDYPMPATYPDFPSAAQMLTYLHSYADHYRLQEHIEYNTNVRLVAPAPITAILSLYISSSPPG